MGDIMKLDTQGTLALSASQRAPVTAPASRNPYGRNADLFAVARDVASKETAVRGLESTGEINAMVEYFLSRGRYRDACIFVIGCNTGMRVGDLIEFRWRDICDENGVFNTVTKIERKTGKRATYKLNQAVCEMVLLYKAHAANYHPDAFMFASDSNRKSHVPPGWRRAAEQERMYAIDVQPMHTRSVARIIREAAKELGLYRDDRHVSSHTMRKTATGAAVDSVVGYTVPDRIMRMATQIELAKKMANHSKITTTAQHYVDYDRILMGELYGTLNFGLEIIQKYKTSGGG